MRRYRRRDLEIDTSITPLSIGGQDDNPGKPQEALKGKTKNVSAGGAMVEVAFDIGKSSYMLVQLHIEEDDFPEFLLGQSMWTLDDNIPDGTIKKGIKFLSGDELAALKNEDIEIDIPPEAMGLDEKKQKALDKLLGDILRQSDE
jgi:PilZ domain-containing protein